MSIITIHQLPAAPPLVGTEEVPLQAGASTLKATTQDIANLAVVVPGPPGPPGPPGAPGAPGPPGPSTVTDSVTMYAGGTDWGLLLNRGGVVQNISPSAIPGLAYLVWTGAFLAWGDPTYNPTTPADWSGTPPVNLWEAVDRLAAWMSANFTTLPKP